MPGRGLLTGPALAATEVSQITQENPAADSGDTFYGRTDPGFS